MMLVNIGTNLNGAHDAAGKARESACDLRHSLTNSLLDVSQIGPSERRWRWRRRWAVWSGAKQLVTRDARAAFKLVEVCTHLKLQHSPHSLVHAPHVTDCAAGQTRRLGAKVLRPRPFDWIEQCFTFPPTQYRLYGGRFLQVKRPNQQYQSTEGTYRTQKNQTYNNQTINTKHSKSPSLH